MFKAKLPKNFNKFCRNLRRKEIFQVKDKKKKEIIAIKLKPCKTSSFTLMHWTGPRSAVFGSGWSF
jgi:hypothetical protein